MYLKTRVIWGGGIVLLNFTLKAYENDERVIPEI